MMKSEFESLAGRNVTDEQYKAIETLYMSSNLEKAEFVKSIRTMLKSIPQPEKKKDIKRMAVRDRSGYRKTPNGCYYHIEYVELVDIDIKTGKYIIKPLEDKDFEQLAKDGHDLNLNTCWKQSSRNEVRRLQKDENGLTGMAKYIVEEKNRVKSEKRWNSSQGLRDPDIKVVHSKRPTAKAGGYKKIGTYVETMRKGHEQVREQMLKWYPDFDFTDAGIYYNDFNSMFYIRARMRKRRQQ